MSKESRLAAVQVAVRIRPFTKHDGQRKRNEVLRVQDKMVFQDDKLFTFDYVFGPATQQCDVFPAICEKLMYKFVDGYNVTMLAYGQTSSGKTYTMGTAQVSGSSHGEDDGIVPRAMAFLFKHLEQADPVPTSRSSSISSDLSPYPGILMAPTRTPMPTGVNGLRPRNTVKVSFVEIYNEELIDLLNSAPPHEKAPITIREDKRGQIYWTGVKEMTVNHADDVLKYLQKGTDNRATGSTNMNEKSSRSHAIFSVTLKQEKWVPSNLPSSRATSPVPSKMATKSRSMSRMYSRSQAAPTPDQGEWVTTTSKLHFVDLAGSERLKRTAAEGDRLKEGININAGLHALGNVISALGDPSKRNTHIPYRDSKLTRLLQDSLGGSAMTLMIACVSPAEDNAFETLNTLQYANRTRNIKNRAEKNEVEEWMMTDNVELLRGMVAKLRSEVHLSKTILPSTSPPSTVGSDSSSSPIPNGELDQLYQDQCLLNADLRRQIEELDSELTFTRERNRVVEQELRQSRRGSSQPVDFQHLVEPVIEEYEKSVSALELQLSQLRAALKHAETEIEDKAHYAEDLEYKLNQSVKEAMRDQHLLQELRDRIMKFKEMDENTEAYIADLERKLEEAKDKYERSERNGGSLKEKLEQLESSLQSASQPSTAEASTPPPTSGDKESDPATAVAFEEEIKTKDTKIETLEQQLETSQTEHKDKEDTMSALEAKIKALESQLDASTERVQNLEQELVDRSVDALAAGEKKAITVESVTDNEMEELMQRMNALKIELGNREALPPDDSTGKEKRTLKPTLLGKPLGLSWMRK